MTHYEVAASLDPHKDSIAYLCLKPGIDDSTIRGLEEGGVAIAWARDTSGRETVLQLTPGQEYDNQKLRDQMTRTGSILLGLGHTVELHEHVVKTENPGDGSVFYALRRLSNPQ